MPRARVTTRTAIDEVALPLFLERGLAQVTSKELAQHPLLRRFVAETATTPLEQARRRHHCPATILRVVRWGIFIRGGAHGACVELRAFGSHLILIQPAA